MDLEDQDSGTGLKDIHKRTPVTRKSRVGLSSMVRTPSEESSSELKDILRKEYLFKYFEDALVDHLVSTAETLTFRKGDEIVSVSQALRAPSLYIIKSGSVNSSVELDAKGVHVRESGPGDTLTGQLDILASLVGCRRPAMSRFGARPSRSWCGIGQVRGYCRNSRAHIPIRSAESSASFLCD